MKTRIASLERGRFYGKVKIVTVRRKGRVVAQMPFKQLVKEVADDPNFSVARYLSMRPAGTRAVKANSAKAALAQPPKQAEFDEAVSLLRRVRPLLQDTQRAGKLKEQIESFLERVV